jgi:hypothetical protein
MRKLRAGAALEKAPCSSIYNELSSPKVSASRGQIFYGELDAGGRRHRGLIIGK